MKHRRILVLLIIVLLSAGAFASIKASTTLGDRASSTPTRIHDYQTPSTHASREEVLQLDQEQLQAWLKGDKFYGKIHTNLYEKLSETNPSEMISVLVTYDEAIPKEEMMARISSKTEGIQITFAGTFVPVLVCKLLAAQVTALEEVEGVKQIFANSKMELYQDREDRKGRGGSQSFFDLQKETADLPRLYLNESTGIIGAPQLWDLGITGDDIYIAIIDSGVNWTHPDLTGKVVLNVSFVPGEDPMDYMGHGTHVAGIVAGTGAASGGRFRGVAPGAYIMNIKAFNKTGYADLEWVLAALEKTSTVKPLVGVSMSWGTQPLPEGHPINLYMAEFVKHDIVPVAAVGNAAYYWTVGSPANSPYVISVGATAKNDRPAFFTSKGPDPYTLRALPVITAPGDKIVAPISGWLAEDYALPENPYYASLSGTSMAAPHVAGAIALLSSAFPSAPTEAIKVALISSADDIEYDLCAMGAGRLNVYNAYEVLNRTHVLAGVHPKIITGMEAPFVARFPCDEDYFNLTVFTSTPLTDAHLVLTGNASQIFFVQQYELGALEDYAFVGANSTIPADAVPGLYVGILGLWNGTTLMTQTPIEIEVAERASRSGSSRSRD